MAMMKVAALAVTVFSSPASIQATVVTLSLIHI